MYIYMYIYMFEWVAIFIFTCIYLPIIRNKMNNASAEKYNRYRDTGSFTRIDQVITVVKKEERYDTYDSYLNK